MTAIADDIATLRSALGRGGLLYVRTRLLAADDADAVVSEWPGSDAGRSMTSMTTMDDHWLRMNGPFSRYEHDRITVIPNSGDPIGMPWCVRMKAQREDGLADFIAAGCVPEPPRRGVGPRWIPRSVYAFTPARLILGACWCPWIADAFALAERFAPLSDAWMVAVDRMLADGHASAERIADLWKRGPTCPIVRALADVHARADWPTIQQIAGMWTASLPQRHPTLGEPLRVMVREAPSPVEADVVRLMLQIGNGHTITEDMGDDARWSPRVVADAGRAWINCERPSTVVEASAYFRRRAEAIVMDPPFILSEDANASIGERLLENRRRRR